MPGLSGIELQQELTERKVDLPIVFMTGHGDIPTSVQAMKHGAVDFLPKPVDDSLLLQTVRQAIGVKEIEAHLAGELSYEECLEKIATSTRQYAKRQRNWFRREEWLQPVEGSQSVEQLVEAAKEIIARS